MSTIKVTNIEHGSTTDGGIQLDSSGHVTIDGQQLPTAGALSNRNLIINGAMNVAQRGTSETGVTTGGIYTADRWKLDKTDEATYTIEQSTDSPAGFKNSLKFTVTTADGTVAADDYAACHYLLEGNDIAPLGFGASGAKSFTLSFYVKSSETGTFGLSFQNSDNGRNFDSSYSISTADTWERKTITIPGDTSGTWLTDNGTGIKIWWSFLVGSTYEASAVSTAWGTSLGLGLDGQVQLASISNATWQITGVQLEVGEKATPFEHRSFGDELHKCQRYYYEVTSASTNANMNQQGVIVGASATTCEYLPIPPAPMRAAPTVSLTDDVGIIRADGGSDTIEVNLQGQSFTALPNGNGFSGHCWLTRKAGTGFDIGSTGRLCTADPAGKLAFDAEL